MFANDKKNGEGIYISPKNIVLKGVFHDDELKDNYGSLEYDNGDKFEGQVIQMKRHGKGKLILHKGGSFEGEWKEDYIMKGVLEL